MVDSIKITALQDIGANIAYTTLVPVVNANINGGNLVVANFFSGDGGFLTNVAGGGSNYSNSNVANYLPTFTGNVGAGNVNVTGGVYTFNLSSTGLASLTTLNVSATSNLGGVGNVKITGGSAGQKLTTDGAGNLSWTNDANSSYGNSNVVSLLSAFGSNTITTTGNVSVGNLGVANISSPGNINVTANVLTWLFDNQGALHWPGGIGQIDTNNSTFEIHSTNGLMISTNESNSSQSFLFDTAGVFTAPGNVNLLGSRLNVGPTAANVANLLNPTLVIANSGSSYIQAAIINSDANGSSDWSADGAGGSDDAAWTDMGFTGYNFNDANFTITEPGDGYLFVQSYANGLGGNLVLATGDNSNTADIVFATGGFLANAEFARIDHANDVFHLTRANSGIRFADGTTQTTAATGGTGTELVNGNNSLVLDGDGNIVLEGTPSGNAINRGLVWDYGANANGVNSTLRQDNAGLTVRAWTENGGGANGYSAPVNIVTNQDAATSTWTFDGQGNLTVPSGSINSINDGGQLGAQVLLQPDLGKARLAARTLEYTQNFNSGGWTSANYTGTQVDIIDAPNLLNFVSNNTIFTSAVDRTFSINGGEPVPYTGYGASGNNVTLYTDITADPDPTVVTSIDFYYQSESYFGIDYDDGGLDMIAVGLTINIDNDQTSGPDINLRSGDDITLQAKDKALGSESEGGDINIYAGDGADDDGGGNTSSTGGDILIDAGRGGDGNTGSGSQGGFTRVSGGAGGAAGVTSTAGSGGYVDIQGGDGGTDGGNTSLGGVGGNVSITAGLTRQEGVNGSNVVISSGQAGPNALAGNVEIFTPASANGFGGTWRFDGNGKLTFPGTPRIDTYTNNFEVQAAENINFEANAVVNIYTDTGNAAYQWQFGDDGNLILAGGNSVIQSIANSSLDPTLPNVSTMTFTPDQGYSSQSLVLDPTAPGHIHLRAYAFSNIDEPAANIFLGGEDTSFEVTYGANNEARIHSGGNDWTFGNDGNLTIPGSSGGFIKTVSNASIGIAAVDNGTNNPAQILSINAGSGAPTSIISAYSTNVAVQTNAAGTINTWAFDSAGNLTLPGNTVAINFANGSAAFSNIVAWTAAPIANTSAGTAGQAAYDSGGNLYVCVATNTWSKFSGTTSW